MIKCYVSRLDGKHLLEMIKGKRLVFVGDSLNRNMWESLVCILKNSVKNPKNVFEAHGRHQFRGEAEYSFVFKVRFLIEYSDSLLNLPPKKFMSTNTLTLLCRTMIVQWNFM